MIDILYFRPYSCDFSFKLWESDSKIFILYATNLHVWNWRWYTVIKWEDMYWILHLPWGASDYSIQFWVNLKNSHAAFLTYFPKFVGMWNWWWNWSKVYWILHLPWQSPLENKFWYLSYMQAKYHCISTHQGHHKLCTSPSKSTNRLVT